MTLVQLGSEEPSQEEGEGSEEDEGSGECLVSPQSGKQDVGVVSAEGLDLSSVLFSVSHLLLWVLEPFSVQDCWDQTFQAAAQPLCTLHSP